MSADSHSPRRDPDVLAKLGERIRRARLKQGLTQSALTGEELTRNMLSRIENGIAYPSLPTLCYLAERLKLPPAALLEDTDIFYREQLTAELRQLAAKKNWQAMLLRLEEEALAIPADPSAAELRALIASAHYHRAWELYRQGQITGALRLLEEAVTYTQSNPDTPLCTEDIRLSQLAFTENACEEPGIEPRLRAMVCRINELAGYLWAKSLLAGREGKSFSEPDERAEDVRRQIEPLLSSMTDALLRGHIEAKLDMASADYLSAKACLLRLCADPDALPPALLFELTTDLEICCKCCGDFENAYKYANIKLALTRRLQ